MQPSASGPGKTFMGSTYSHLKTQAVEILAYQTLAVLNLLEYFGGEWPNVRDRQEADKVIEWARQYDESLLQGLDLKVFDDKSTY